MDKSSLSTQTGMRLGAIALTKAIGFTGRVVLTRMIGAEGIGLFQIAYAYFGFVLMLVTGGFPTALALYTARRKDQGWPWFKRLAVLLMVGGAIAFLLTLAFATKLSHVMGSEKSYFFIRALAPAFIVVPSLSLLRGYLQGLEHYQAVAFSEVAEQLVRVALMLGLCYLLLFKGTYYAGGMSMIGTTFGGITAFVILLVFSRRNVAEIGNPISLSGTDKTWFVRSSLAICLTRLLIPFSDMFDAIIIPERLQSAGYSDSQATALFGLLTGMALLVAYMPTIVTAAISHTMTMKLSTSWKKQQENLFRTYSNKAIQYAWNWGLVSGLFLSTFSSELALLLFNSKQAGQLILWLSSIPLVVGLREITTSILWAQDRRKVTFISTAIGMVCAICCHYILIPYLYLTGAVIGILLMELIVLFANVFALRRLLPFFYLSKMAVSALLMLFIGVPLGYAVREASHTFLSGTSGGVIGMLLYGACIIVCYKCLKRHFF
ncbi:oligosaccharide flippase family protein [Paenibacillus sp. NPDC057886]|uniref:oligosaccharide flippase family protein n=1 Tax=Paenibacillus sp. NPDC057886 TaxID=3346270 RepID=UPI0036AB7E1A